MYSSKVFFALTLILILENSWSVDTAVLKGRLLLRTGRSRFKYTQASSPFNKAMFKTMYTSRSQTSPKLLQEVSGNRIRGPLVGLAQQPSGARSSIDCGSSARCFWDLFGVSSGTDRDYFGGSFTTPTQGRPAVFTPPALTAPLTTTGGAIAFGPGYYHHPYNGYGVGDYGNNNYDSDVEICDEYYDPYTDEYVEDCSTITDHYD